MEIFSGRVATRLFPFLLAGAAFAQETTGRIGGCVTDQSGAGVPGARVVVSGSALLRTVVASTDSAGAYVFLTLPPGTFIIEVSARGFAQMRRTGVDLQLGQALRFDFQLRIAAERQSFVVAGGSTVLDVEQSTVAAHVTAAVIDHLPKGRGFDSLIAIAPGARYESKSGGYQVDGASGSENAFLVDGMDQTSLYSGVLPASGNLPFEFVQELQVKSSGFEAQYGGAMGGVVNVLSKSGGNRIHGEAGAFVRTDSMQARPRPTLEIDPEDDSRARYLQNSVDGYRYLSPGATLGGPIRKNLIWMFAGFCTELTRWERPVTFLAGGEPRTFVQKDRRDFLMGKIDVAPTSRLRGYAGYIYSPAHQNGVLPARDGSDDPSLPWTQKGGRWPAASYSFGTSYTATPRLVFSGRGGYSYTNYKDYGVPRGVSVFQNSNAAYAEVPATWRQDYTGYTPGYGQNARTERDIQTRFRAGADASYILRAAGQHMLQAGGDMNRLHMDTHYGGWPDGLVRFYWDSIYTGMAARAGEKMTGAYGYLLYFVNGVSARDSSNNQSLFVQDSWRIHRRVTLHLGLRAEREFLPSFRAGRGVPSRPIEFGFGQKLAPRAGVAWDVKGDGRWRVAAAFGLFYDMMKYALPQGSFGGALYQMWFYPLDNPDPGYYLPKITRTADGLADAASLKDVPLFEWVNLRIPANDPDDNTIDPDLQPMRRRVWDASIEYALVPNLTLGARYTHNSIDRAIEDVGTLTDAGEKYFIANPASALRSRRVPGLPAFQPPRRQNASTMQSRFASTNGCREVRTSPPATRSVAFSVTTAAWRVRTT